MLSITLKAMKLKTKKNPPNEADFTLVTQNMQNVLTNLK